MLGIGRIRVGQRDKARWNDPGSDPRNASGLAANPAAREGRTYGCNRSNCRNVEKALATRAFTYAQRRDVGNALALANAHLPVTPPRHAVAG